MFEFDEHFAELEPLDAQYAISESVDQILLPQWCYLGNDVWKLVSDAETVEIPPEVLPTIANVV